MNSTPDGIRTESERIRLASIDVRHVTPLDSSECVQDQSCYLTVGALCSCDADAHPVVSYAFLGLEPIA